MKSNQKKPTDSLGSRVGTIANKVNKAVSRSWKTDKAISNETGLKFRQTRARLYHGVRLGIYEQERTFRYRLSTKTKKK